MFLNEHDLVTVLKGGSDLRPLGTGMGHSKGVMQSTLWLLHDELPAEERWHSNPFSNWGGQVSSVQ